MVEKTDKTQKLDKNSIITCTVSPDKMSVTLILKKNHEKHIKITSDDILSELDSMGIIFGIEYGVINGAVEFFNEYEEDDDVIIAQGIQPVHGAKGRLECLVVKKDVKIAEKDDDTIDFHEINTITPVKQGQPIFRVTPPIAGKDGKNVYGHIIKPREYKLEKLPVIKNSEIDKNDPNLLISSINGSITFLKDGIRITKYHFVNGDIDLES